MTMTLVDTNIWIDLTQKGVLFEASLLALNHAVEEGGLVMSAVVWAELASGVGTETELEHLFGIIPFEREPLPFAAAFPAGRAHRLYRSRGGGRERTLPDFLIGAHALVGGHRLLTRDSTRYRSYFPDLAIVTPEGSA